MTRIASALALFCSITLPGFGQYAALQVPKQIQYQGRVATGTGGAWAGTEGYFVFALVQGATVLWNNWQGTASPADPGTVTPGAGQVLTLPVNQGVFSIRLGDGSGSNQQIPATVFFDGTGNAVRTGVKLAVWFSPDDITFARLSPDVEFTSVPYAMVAGIAESVQARAVSTAMLADAAVTSAKIADGSVVAADFSTTLQADGLNPPGSVIAFAGPVAPSGWVFCDGTSKLRTDPTYARLYDVIGAIYGAVDGTHFNLPDMKGRVPLGAGQGDLLTNRVLSTKLGEESHKLINSEMPSHNHGGQAFASASHKHWLPFGDDGSGNLYGSDGRFGTRVVTLPSRAQINMSHFATTAGVRENASDVPTDTTAIPPDGGVNSHNVMQPSIVLNYIIKL